MTSHGEGADAPETELAHARPVAVATGGRQGLGLAAAQAIADEGFDLVIVDIQDEDDEVAAVRSSLSARGAASAYLRGDIADVAAAAAPTDRLWQAFGRVDCLVDNAGIADRPLTDVLEKGPEAFDRVMDVNLRGTFFLTQLAGGLNIPRSP